jgi:hypothetical protein
VVGESIEDIKKTIPIQFHGPIPFNFPSNALVKTSQAKSVPGPLLRWREVHHLLMRRLLHCAHRRGRRRDPSISTSPRATHSSMLLLLLWHSPSPSSSTARSLHQRLGQRVDEVGKGRERTRHSVGGRRNATGLPSSSSLAPRSSGLHVQRLLFEGLKKFAHIRTCKTTI